MMKMKSCFLLILIILAAVVCTAACADGETRWYQCGRYRYTLLEDGTACIDRYSPDGVSDPAADIIVPSELDGIKVTAIGDGAFANDTSFDSDNASLAVRLIIPEGVTSIGSRAFEGCKRLETVILPDSLVSIGDLAFHQCYALTEVNIPDGLTHLGINPFFRLSPDSIRISPDHPCFEVRGGMLFSKADGCLIAGLNPGESDQPVIIPEGTRRIGDYAFFCRSDIVSIVLPDGLEEIGSHAFEQCYLLASLSLPDGLVSIGDFAFDYCYGLSRQTVAIPDSITYMGDDPFAHTMPDILLPDNHPCLEIVDGALYSKPDRRLIRQIERKAEKASIREGTRAIGGKAFLEQLLPEGFVIPEGVTSIGDQAFDGVDTESLSFVSYPVLSELKLPDSLERIGAYAFRIYPFFLPVWNQPARDSFQLILPEALAEIGEGAFWGARMTGVTIPGSVNVVPRDAFRQCQMLTDAVLAEGVSAIGECAFAESGLSAIELPRSLRFIGDQAFSACSLTDIALPDGLTYIGSRAFEKCPLVSLTIPDSVTAMGISPFFHSALTEIRVSPDHPVYAVIDGALIEKSTGRLLWAPVTEEKEPVIPGETRMIGEYAFYMDFTLEKATIPDGVTEIGDFAFYSTRRMKSITIPDSVTRIGTDAFAACGRLVLIVSPGSYAEQYCIENGLDYTAP